MKISNGVKLLNQPDNSRELIIVNLARFLFGGLIIFELLNYLKILEFNTQFTWLGLLITAIFCLILLEFTAIKFREKKGYQLHWSIWLIVLASLSLDAFGDFFYLYGKFIWWDQLAHFFVSAVACFTLFIVFNAFWIDKFKFVLLLKTGRFKLSLFLAATATMTLAALYEIEEYLEDVLFKTNRLGPGADTADDLTFNLAGVLVIVIFLSLYYLKTHRRKILE